MELKFKPMKRKAKKEITLNNLSGQINSLSQQMEKGFGQVTSNFNGISKHFGGVAKEFQQVHKNHEQLVTIIAESFNGVQEQLDGLKSDLSTTNGQVGKIGIDLESAKLDLTDLKDGQEQIKLRLDNVAYRLEFKQLDKRVSFLEKKTGVHYK